MAIENLDPSSGNTPAEIATLFGADAWLTLNCGGTCTPTGGDKRLLAAAGASPASPLDFYRRLLGALDAPAQIVRLRNPAYPLHRLLSAEMDEAFGPAQYDYVLSTAAECGLTGYFAERFNAAALDRISHTAQAVMPEGYFNGMATQRCGRHWFSLDLRRFYLQDNFERLFDSPRSLCVNAIPTCNYRCEKCQYHSPRVGQRRDWPPAMTVEKFQLMLDRTKAYKRLASVCPTISGEPLLHPQIDTLVRLTKKAGYSSSFATNAALLDGEMTARLLDAGLDGIAFSVDSCDPQTYQALQHGNLEAVEGNILHFQQEAAKRQRPCPMTMICVVSKANESQVEAYRDRWLGRGIAVVFSAEHDIENNNTASFAHSRWGPSQRMPCHSLWHGLYLQNDGRLVTCGATAGSDGLKDNFFEQEPQSLWRCHAMETLRRQQLTGQRPGYCGMFSCWTGLMNTWAYEDGRLINHTLGTWMEPLPPPLSAPQATLESEHQPSRSILRRALRSLRRRLG
ncbi:MAG: radical SAM protein [Planctomycetaceae bacterium]|nr:radical SAM protein [Planctomycetaceae bacterium]